MSTALRDDPRVDPRLVAAVEPFGLADPLPPSALDASAPLEVIRSVLGKLEAGSAPMIATATHGLAPVEGVERSVEVVTGGDGHEITLHVHRPADADRPAPGVLHLHGGGGVMMAAVDPNYVRWRDELAALGLVVVGVEFRNGAGRLGAHPFPAGLDDCADALAWVDARRDVLGIDRLVVSGDSGGANLAIATALRAKREGVLDRIDGVHAMCPYISGTYAAPPEDLRSLVDNDGILVSVALMGAMAKAYTPDPADSCNPLAWPYHATAEDLSGLPPHVISVNELDPLRDEGLAHYRHLLAAGVPARARTVNGTFHAAETGHFAAIPDVARSTLADVAAFARSL
ncbi:alpha/beta hydrolase fold domain-containing protein [Dermatobacter hominis]|uniref:alpha/beta hydrolase fold domain-containing protein n=1 Tax=Dermatobacter hominis TaxID=2884263 RepID=UPI001D12AA63|nr:alpha/beta hydrolase fold domain-containing protein [Dermatobacter hominis]UDY36705.1 alpha/beta hydrolase [Dermatobacter hominis]